eukprot:3699999-Ditylum_brightwellii.AAC.1
MGYNRNKPRAVVFGSKYSGRLGFTNVKVTQLGAKICGAMKHNKANTKAGKKFIAMTKWAQLSTGTGTPILEETHHLMYLEGNWLRTLLADIQSI